MMNGVFCFKMSKIKELYRHFLTYPKVSTDSRVDVENTIFFALKGDHFDGNKFAESALKNGARFAVIDDKTFVKGEQYLLVDNSLTALQELAQYHRKQLPIPVIGITGSNGKTTTKELVASVFQTTYNINYTPGNLNNHIGVPLSILQINNSTELAVIEMGANHQGEIAELCKISQPDTGIITNIGKAHIEGFGSFEGVVKAKSELYEYIKLSGGELIVNHDDELLMQLSEGINRFTFGTTNEADLCTRILSATPFLEISFSLNNQVYQCKSNLIGRYNLVNISVAIATALRFHIPPEKIIEGIESYYPENNRSQLIETGDNRIIMDAYNANPVSMKEAISSFEELNPLNPYLILGDMFELGHISNEEHKNILETLASSSFKNVLLVGKDFYQFRDRYAFVFFQETKEVADHLGKEPIKSATILVKGSRGMMLEKLLKYL